MLVAVIILSVVLSVTFYIVWNLLRKVERLEDTSNDLSEYLYNTSTIIDQMNERVQEIDKKGTFESDDEVGFFFEQLKEIQSILNSINVNERTDTQEEARS
jgi:type II secretory pathway component PulJ